MWYKVTNVEPSTDKAGRPSFKVSASIVAVDQQTGNDKDGEQARVNAGQATKYMNIQGSPTRQAADARFRVASATEKEARFPYLSL